MPNSNYIKIKEAARMLGVSALTLRNWDKSGRLRALRHPMNNYRVYRLEDIEAVMGEIESGAGVRKIAKREFKKVVIRHLTD
jgi:DNA (cytosine-5)-methyltransferase 1